jgi:hypothetical protein
VSSELSPADLARAISGLYTWALEQATAEEPAVTRRLREHFGSDPAELPVVARSVNRYEHPNFQVALERWSAAEGRAIEALGISAMAGYRLGLAELAQPPGGMGSMLPDPGPVEYVTVELGTRAIVCVESALFLIADGERRLALLLKTGDEMHERQNFGLEVMAPSRDDAEALHDEFRALMNELNVYRREILTFGGANPFGGASLEVLPVPEISPEAIVLPAGLLERIQRQTIGFAAQAQRLKAAGRHIRRGLLLYGPPGTGKTLTAMYLARRMPDRTVIVLSGEAIRAVRSACEMARTLQPALVILEDVDLVAKERSHYNANTLLFELLNAMDGVADDADIMFFLTTNRVSVLEPALASRPGRIDEAIELPLPDAEGRRRLLELYGNELGLDIADLDPVIAATEGVSPAFIRELCRRSALLAAEASTGEIAVTPDLVDRALAELTESADRVAQSLLGAKPLADEAAADDVSLEAEP